MRKAFTLIELLVVIAIIGILLTVSIVSLATFRQKSRDAKRTVDIKQVQTALQMYFADKGRYPTVEEFGSGIIYATSSSGTTTYLSVIPSAPTIIDGDCASTSNQYIYQVTDSGRKYSLQTCLGGKTGELASGLKCYTTSGVLNTACPCLDDSNCSGNNICQNGACTDVVVYNNSNYTCGTNANDLCTYHSIKIGSQYWLKENLNLGLMVSAGVDQANNSTLEKYCAFENQSQCDFYGASYQLNEGMSYNIVLGGQGICPNGWHIPTEAEMHSLELSQANPATEENCDGARLSPNEWGCSPSGTVLGAFSTFAARVGGFRNPASGNIINVGSCFYFWSSTTSQAGSYWLRVICLSGVGGIDSSKILRSTFSSDYGIAIRCVKN